MGSEAWGPDLGGPGKKPSSQTAALTRLGHHTGHDAPLDKEGTVSLFWGTSHGICDSHTGIPVSAPSPNMGKPRHRCTAS